MYNFMEIKVICPIPLKHKRVILLSVSQKNK